MSWQRYFCTEQNYSSWISYIGPVNSVWLWRKSPDHKHIFNSPNLHSTVQFFPLWTICHSARHCLTTGVDHVLWQLIQNRDALGKATAVTPCFPLGSKAEREVTRQKWQHVHNVWLPHGQSGAIPAGFCHNPHWCCWRCNNQTERLCSFLGWSGTWHPLQTLD